MLDYDQPIDQAKPDAGPAARRRRPASACSIWSSLLWRRKIAIASAALICACVAVAIGKSLTPKYTATAQLYVDPRELAAGRSRTDAARPGRLRPRDGGRKPGAPDHLEQRAAAGDPATPISTRIPNSAAATSKGLFGIAARPVRDRAAPDRRAAEAHPDGALEALIRHINVKKTDRTFIVDIDVWSYEPAKAAMLANAIVECLSRRIQAVAGRRRPARHQRPVRPAEGIAGTAAQRREHARGLQGAEQFRRHPGHADQRPAALRQQPAARRGAGADARCAGQIRPDRSQPQGVDRCRRHSRGAAVADHRQSARAICRCPEASGRIAERTGAAASRAAPDRDSRSRICAAPSTRKSSASRSRRRTT